MSYNSYTLGKSAQQNKSRSQGGIDTSQISAEPAPCNVTLMLEALMQLAMQPFPFSLNHSHLVKLHLTFMSFFLNRKDNIS